MNTYYLHRDLLLKMRVRSTMECPVIQKVVLHASTKAALTHRANVLPLITGLALVGGQAPVLTRAKRSIASFRLRKDQLLGCKSTLRRQRARALLATFVLSVLPQARTLLPPRVEPGQISFGVPTLVRFPQIEDHYELFEHVGGMEVTAVASSHAPILLSWYGVPFRR
jgi:large subunit ribosomal protein L5